MLFLVRTLYVLPLLLGGSVACSSSTSSGSGASTSDAGDDGAFVCSASTPALNAKLETYDAGMAQWGTSKVFQFVLLDSSPVPVSAGSSLTWTLEILDASGKPVTGATFTTIHPWMPAHGHGTSTVMSAPGSKPGTYVLQPLYLYMPGVWETDITVQAGTQKDSTSFYFCMQ
jgi:YtkA-like